MIDKNMYIRIAAGAAIGSVTGYALSYISKCMYGACLFSQSPLLITIICAVLGAIIGTIKYE